MESPTMSSPEDQFNFPAYDGRYSSGIPLSNLKELEGLIQLRIPRPVSSHFTWIADWLSPVNVDATSLNV